MREWADVAILAKTKNLQGGFVAKSAAGLPFLLDIGMQVAFVPPVLDAPRRAQVSYLQEQNDGSFYIEFEEVDGIDQAELLAGCHVLVRRDEVDGNLLACSDQGIIGWEVVDRAHGVLGTAAALIENPGQTLLEVSRAGAGPSSSEGTILIPLVDEFLVDVDEDARRLTVATPDGLLDL